MIVSKAFQAQTSAATLLEAKAGRQYLAVQNHDASNPICVTLGGAPAVISTPNGMIIKAGEFGELSGRVGAKVTIISQTGTVNCTFFED